MIEIYGDLWTAATDFDAVCITTNGFVKSNGEAVMGRGCAREAAQYWPELPRKLGILLRARGNAVYRLGRFGFVGSVPRFDLLSFPVKHRWMEPADLDLIEESTRQLVAMTGRLDWPSVLLPRPGCGNGGLKWKDVRKRIAPSLDERFTIIARPEEQ